MKQSILVAPMKSEVVERPIPAVGPGDVLVRVKACGVCSSDLHGWLGDGGPYPREYGHEVAGEVVQVGDGVSDLRPDMAVTGLFGKGFAEYAVAPRSRVAAVPAGIPCEQALGEPLSCIVSGLRRTRIELGDRVAVVGVGYMGLLALQVARLRGPVRLIAVDERAEALENARRLGADETYLSAEVPANLKLTEWSQLGRGRGVDVAIEASGSEGALSLAGEMVREHGVLSIVGYHQGGRRQVDLQLWLWKALEVLSAHERRVDYQMDCLRRGLALVAAGRIDLASLLTHRFDLERVDEGFRALQAKPAGFVKAVITVNGR